jgi:transcriptional regulator with XRE-family HTH domain
MQNKKAELKATKAELKAIAESQYHAECLRICIEQAEGIREGFLKLMKESGPRLMMLRERAGWNQVEAAAILGVSPSLVSKIESGERPLQEKMLIRISNSFIGVSIHDFLCAEYFDPEHHDHITKKLGWNATYSKFERERAKFYTRTSHKTKAKRSRR